MIARRLRIPYCQTFSRRETPPRQLHNDQTPILNLKCYNLDNERHLPLTPEAPENLSRRLHWLIQSFQLVPKKAAWSIYLLQPRSFAIRASLAVTLQQLFLLVFHILETKISLLRQSCFFMVFLYNVISTRFVVRLLRQAP